MAYHMPIADAEELALWLVRHMTMKQRHALMSERPLLYARTFPSVDADTIIATVRYALDNQDTAAVQFPGSDKFPGSGNVATVPAGLAEDAAQDATQDATQAVKVRHGSDTGDLMGWADKDTALVRFAHGDGTAVKVPVSELRTAHDLRPEMLLPPVRDPWI